MYALRTGVGPADGPYDLLATPESAGRGHSGFRILTLKPSEAHAPSTGDSEFPVLPLTDSCTVTTGRSAFELTGRTGVFASATDFAQLPRASEALVSSANGGTFALPPARTERSSLSARYGPKENVPVESRGTGAGSGQVNNTACRAPSPRSTRPSP
nr:5-deoxy-glucuronate isomerase [Streptomyces sp. NBC_00886]